MPPELQAYLHAAMARPFARPHDDCCTLVADWIVERTGIDPAAGFRGAYADLRGALRLIRGAGGFLAMWKVHMTLAGFDETSDPAVGDVGVVRDGLGREVAAIRVPGAWAGKTERGLHIEDLPMLCAWSLTRG